MGETISGLAEALGKFFALLVDSLTPRSMRLLLLAAVGMLGYIAWVQDAQIKGQQQALLEYRVEMAGFRADVKAVIKSADEGNAELRAIREWLMKAKP